MTTFDDVAANDPVAAQQMVDAGRIPGPNGPATGGPRPPRRRFTEIDALYIADGTQIRVDARGLGTVEPADVRLTINDGDDDRYALIDASQAVGLAFALLRASQDNRGDVVTARCALARAIPTPDGSEL